MALECFSFTKKTQNQTKGNTNSGPPSHRSGMFLRRRKTIKSWPSHRCFSQQAEKSRATIPRVVFLTNNKVLGHHPTNAFLNKQPSDADFSQQTNKSWASFEQMIFSTNKQTLSDHIPWLIFSTSNFPCSRDPWMAALLQNWLRSLIIKVLMSSRVC